MAAMLQPQLLLATVLALCLGVLAQQACSAYGVDYSNGGSYYIDGSSNQYFTFISVFQGCSQESIQPVLVDPDNNQYACSAISTTPSGNQVASTCGIPFSAMKSGPWRIVISGRQIAVQRTINLSVGIPETTTVTATPTIVIGVTSTPRAVTVVSTIVQTQTLILVPPTVTAACQGATQTVTVYPQGPTVTITSTITRTTTSGARTSAWTTTVTTSASCHYPTKKRDLEQRDVEQRDAAGFVAVAAVTVTVTQTTFTVTRSVVTTLPAVTTTEGIFRITTQTITPAASTACVGGGRPGVTVTVQRGNPTPVTQTNIAYRTVSTSGTVWVGQTLFTTISNQASATACWRAGGWYGH